MATAIESTSLYVDTSVLVAAFFNEPQQAVAMALLRAPEWAQVFVSDWTLAEFACAVHAKELLGDTPPAVGQAIRQTLDSLIANNALQRIPVVQDDYAAVRRTVAQTPYLVRGADALHLAVAARIKATHFASLDKTQRIAANSWLVGVECVPGLGSS